MTPETQKLIQEYIEAACWEHYKTIDGIFEITHYYSGWNPHESFWYINHPGYIDDTDKLPMNEFKSFEDAETHLQRILRLWIKENLKVKEKYEKEGGW